MTSSPSKKERSLILSYMLRKWELKRKSSVKNLWIKDLTMLVLKYSDPSNPDKFIFIDTKNLKITNKGKTITNKKKTKACQNIIAANTYPLVKGSVYKWKISFDQGSDSCLHCLGIVTKYSDLHEIQELNNTGIIVSKDEFAYYYSGHDCNIVEKQGLTKNVIHKRVPRWNIGEGVNITLNLKSFHVKFQKNGKLLGKCKITKKARNKTWFAVIGICCNILFNSKNAKMSFRKV